MNIYITLKWSVNVRSWQTLEKTEEATSSLSWY